jgi:hypothetical protein
LQIDESPSSQLNRYDIAYNASPRYHFLFFSARRRPDWAFSRAELGVDNRAGAFTVLSKKGPFPATYGALTASGCTLQDVIDSCSPAFLTNGLGGQYMGCISQVTENLVKQGNLSSQEAEAIRDAAEIAVPFFNSL